MSKLSGGQFAAFLLITDAFTLFCLMGNVSVITCAAFLTGILLQFGLSIPAIRYYSGGGTSADDAAVRAVMGLPPLNK